MSDYERIKVLLYQYLMFKSDLYDELKLKATRKLQSTKKLSSAEFEQIYRDLLICELFDTISSDIYKLLK